MVIIAVADENEILEFFTNVMRREGYLEEENVKFSDSFKAAELLAKYYGMFDRQSGGEIGDVIIVDNIEEQM